MAKNYSERDLRPVWRLAVAVTLGLVLAGLALAWPGAVRSASPPVITQVEVTSSKGAFFYSPPLGQEGGGVYFNNLAGKGAGQILTVTVTVSDDNARSFAGGLAFGVQPSTTVSATQGTNSVWSVSYAVQAEHDSEIDVLFTSTDADGLTDTLTIDFLRDVEAPTTPGSFVHTPDADSGGDGFTPDSGWEDDPTAEFAWSAANDSGGSGLAGYQLTSSAPATSAFHTGTSGGLTMAGDGSYSVSLQAVDRVGNLSAPASAGFIHIDRSAPVNGDLTLSEVSGGEYLYIANPGPITTGTLYYNNEAVSRLGVTANTEPSRGFAWGGDAAQGWKVAFSPGWGESSVTQVGFPPFYHVYRIDPPETTGVFTVYYINKAGNVLAIPIQAELDIDGPVLTFSSFSEPDWTSGSVRWYRTAGLAGGWDYSTDVVSEQSGVAPAGQATWDHSVGSGHDQVQSTPGAGTFSGVSDDPDGQVTVTVVLTDRVNNASSIATTFKLDGTPPGVTPDGWSETSSYLHILGGQLFFSHAMSGPQWATLSGSAIDPAGGSELDRAVFSSETNLAEGPPDDISPGTWSGSYKFDAASTPGDGQVVVSVYDNVGNVTTRTFTYIEDAAAPSIGFTGVTDPGYDPDGNDLNDVDNWYKAGNFDDGPGDDDWVFFFDLDDAQTGVRSIRADWDHSNDADDQLGYDPGLDASGIFGTGSGSSGSSVRDDADGVVTVTLRAEDNVGNVGTDSLTLRIDNTPPTLSGGSWSESSAYLFADGDTLYFSQLMAAPQQATLSGEAGDGSGAGLDSVTFSPEPTLAGSPGPAAAPAAWAGSYAFNSSSSQGDGSVVVTARDHLGHQVTQAYTYVLDNAAPSTPGNFRITTSPVTPGYYKTRSLALSWNASSDNSGGSGLEGYYLGTTNPPTTLYPPSATGATFEASGDGSFTLYLQARDRVGNARLTSVGPITVDTLGPFTDLTLSPEEQSRRFLVEWFGTDQTTSVVKYDVQYRISPGDWTNWLNGTSQVSAYFGPNSPVVVNLGSFYEFRARAYDTLNNVGEWSRPQGGQLSRRFVFLPLIVSNFDTSIPFAVFDGFETGEFVGWKTYGSLPRSIVTSPRAPNGGNYTALLGSPAYGCGDSPKVPVGQAVMQAYVRVPSAGTPYLRFDYRVFSYDSVRDQTGEWWDRLEVRVDSTVLARYGDPDVSNLSCSNLYDTRWKQGEFNLSAHRGRTVILTFFNENHKDAYWNTYSYLDNIRIDVVP
jgi:hypothetical protein